jgi:hypothetical protein
MPSRADLLIQPIGFMPGFELELELIHASYTDAAEDELGLEVAAVFGGCDVGVHFAAQGFDVRH